MERKSPVWSTGLAMFSMFFGAGNIVFPLALGQFTQDKTFFGITGLILTAVLVPLMGLLAMLLFEGDYRNFFKRIGALPGLLLTVLILGLIGPFGGVPRCITMSFSTLSAFGLDRFQWLSLIPFSLFNCALIFLFTYRRNKIVSLLGNVLTPVLLATLAIIVLRGLFIMPHAEHSIHTSWKTFSQGVLDGYNTMDLLAAFFFSSVVLHCLRRDEGTENKKALFLTAARGSLIAAILLGITYIGFAYLASGYSSTDLKEVPSHELLGALAAQILGPSAGLVAGVLVVLACLTTEIALVAAFADFLHKSCKGRLSYLASLSITIFLSFLISTLHFQGISAFVVPILRVFYPALIVLAVLNILHKIKGFKPVKSFFYATVAITLLAFIIKAGIVN